MRKMRRVLAFALAVMMIMSNTVSVNATSASSQPSGTVIDAQTNDDETIVTTSVSDEDENVSQSSENSGEEEPSTPADDSSEPSGEDNNVDEPSSGDVTEPSDGNTTEPSTGEVTTTTSADEGESVETTVETTEELTTEEETTTEEMTTEELLIEAPVLKAVVGDTERDTGENVSMSWINADGEEQDATYYTTIAAAVGAVDTIIDANPDYLKSDIVEFYIDLLEAVEGETEASFSAEGTELVSEQKLCGKLTLRMNGQEIALTGDKGSTAKIDINIEGGNSEEMGTLTVADGVTLQLLPGESDYDESIINTYIQYVNIVYEGTDSKLKLILGNPGQSVDLISRDKGTYLCDVNLPETVDVQICGKHEYVSTNTENKFSSICVEPLTMEDSGETYFPLIQVDGNVTVDTLDLGGSLTMNGKLNVNDTLSVTEGCAISVYDEINVKDMIVKDGVTSEDEFRLCMINSYTEQGEDNYTLEKSGRFNVAGTITLANATPVRITRDYVGSYEEPMFQNGDAIGTMSSSVTVDMFKVNGKGLAIEDGTLFIKDYVFGVKNTTVQGTNDEMYEYATLTDVRNHIQNDKSGASGYTVQLLDSYAVSDILSDDEQLDFGNISGKTDKPVYFSLGYNTLTIDRDVSVSAAAFNWGRVNVEKDITLTLLSSGNTKSKQMQLAQNQITFDAESSLESGLVIGEKDNPGQITVYVPHYVSADSNTKFINADKVDLHIYDNLNYKPGIDANYLYGYVTEEEFLNETLTFRRIVMDKEPAAGDYAEAWISVPIETEYIHLVTAYDFRAYSIDVTDFDVVENSNVSIKAPSTVEWICVYDRDQNGSNNPMFLKNVALYKDGETDPVTVGCMTFESTGGNEGDDNALFYFGAICFERENYTAVNNAQNSSAYLNYTSNGVSNGEVLALVNNASSTNECMNAGYYCVSSEASKPMYVNIEGPDENNLYQVKAYTDYNDIRVYDSTTGISRGFTTLADVKDYIYDLANADGEYTICLNKNITLNIDENLSDAQNAPLYYADNVDADEDENDKAIAKSVVIDLNGYTLTLNDTFGIHVNGMMDGQIKMGKAGLTLPIQDRALWNEPQEEGEEGWWDHSWISNVKVTPHTSGTILRLAESNPFAETEIEPQVSLNNVTFASALSEVWVFNSVDINGSITTKYLNAENGHLYVKNLTVSNEAVVGTDYGLSLAPGGKATIKNLHISTPHDEEGNFDENAEYRINLQKGLNDDDSVRENTASLNITGIITTDEGMKNALRIGKDLQRYTEDKDDDGNVVGSHYEWISEDEFIVGDIVATASNSAVTAKYFAIDGDGRCTVKSGNYIKADTIELRVHYDGYQDGEEWVECDVEALYTSLEDAVKNMPTDFGKAEGNYTFTFMNDEVLKLSANVTIPSFVKSLNLSTEELGEDIFDEDGNWTGWNGYGKWYQRTLDLNGKTLSTSAEIQMNEGVRIISSAAMGKITSTASDCALNINESKPLVDVNGNALEKRDRVLDNVLFTAKNGHVNFEYHDDRNTDEDDYDNVLAASFDVLNFHVNGGCWIIEDNSAKSKNYITAYDFSVNGEHTGEEWFYNEETQQDECNEYDAASCYLSVNQITLTGGNSSIDGRVETSSLSVTGGELYIHGDLDTRWTDDEEGNPVQIPLNITLNNTRFGVNNYVHASNITLSNSARLEVCGHLEADGAVKMAASKLLIRGDEEGYGTVVIGTLSVSSAYAADAMGDYTVENQANFAANNISVSAGTFCNYGIVEAPMVSVKDFDNNSDGGRGKYGHVLCDTFVNTGKMYLGDDTHLLINKSGILNNVNVGDRYGSEGYALIGRSSDATVTFKGTFTKNGEEQQLLGFVTDAYKTITELDEATEENVVVQTVYGNTFVNENNEDELQWDLIALWDDDADTDASHLIALEEDDVLFKTEITSFPVTSIRVLPWTVENDDQRVDNINNTVYQSGKELKITGEYITIYAGYADGGYNWTPLASFSTWKEASAYLNTLNNPSMKYVVTISKDELAIGGKLELPKNVGQIIITSGLDDNESVTIRYQGDITLNTDTIFENVILDAYTLDKKGNEVAAYNSTITANGKYLTLNNVEIADGMLNAIKGNATTVIDVSGSNIVVKSKMSGIGTLNLYNGAKLEVTGGLSVNNLYTASYNTEDNATESIKVLGSTSVLEVKNTLEMDAPTTLDSEGSIKLNEVLSNTAGNTLRTANANKITISGRVLSSNMGAAWNKVDVVKENITVNEQDITVYRYAGEGEDLSDKETAQVMPFALVLSASDNTVGTILATAEKVSPIWFVVEKDYAGYENNEFIDFTYKDGKDIKSGAKGSENVVLSVAMGDTTEVMNTFDTLQEAFTEIDRIASPAMTYVIELKTLTDEVTGDELPYTYKNAKGALLDYTFPKQAAEVIIRPQGDNPITILYNKNLALKSNVTFENIDLKANTKGGTISLGDFCLTMDNSAFDMADGITFNVSGSGTGKSSKLVLTGGTDATISGNLSNVGTVELIGTNLEVSGTTAIGNLVMNDQEVFAGRGAISVINVYTENGTIETSPVMTYNKAKEVTKVTSALTISGKIMASLDEPELTGCLNIDLCVKEDNGTWAYMYLDEDAIAGITTVADNSGIIFAKAVNVNTSAIYLTNNEGEGTVYKKAGNLVYKTGIPQVVLGYYENEDEVWTYCETFADAVTEINNLKTKRDYTIIFVDADMQNPVTFTMPNANYVDTLYLSTNMVNDKGTTDESDDVVVYDVYYKGGIAFTSNVILEDINFMQVAKDAAGEYWPVDALKADAGKFADPVAVKVNGAYILELYNVKFNTPINLDGAGKATLNVNVNTLVQAWPENASNESMNGYDEAYCFIQGSVKNFAQVDVDDNNLVVTGYAAGAESNPTYKVGELNVTELNISEDSMVQVGVDTQITDKVTVKNLNIVDGSLTSYGTMALTNATLSGEYANIAAYGRTFNITGTLTSATEGATLTTALTTKQESALNISGKVVLESPENKINVKVVADLDETDGIVYFDNEITLGSTEVTVLANKQYVQKVISTKLLTAKNADTLMFLADDKSVGGTETIVVGEYDQTNNPDGYILKKVGNDIKVYYGDQVGAALYNVTNDYELYNYYETVNDAVTAIDALKDSTASYRIEVLKDMGSSTSYQALSIPKYADHVVFTSGSVGEDDNSVKNLYYSNDLTLTTNVVFMEIGLEPQVVKTVPKAINVKGFSLTLNNVTANNLGKIDGGSKDSTVTIIGDKLVTINGDLVNVTNYVQDAAEVNALKKVTVTNLILGGGEPYTGNINFYAENAAVTITNIVNNDNDGQNSIYYGQDSNKNPLLTIKGTVTNSGTNTDTQRPQLVLKRSEGVVRLEDATTVKLNNVSKLATVEKAALADVKFVVSNGTEDVILPIYDVVWANKAAYIVSTANGEVVRLMDESNNVISYYLDFSQAVNYINNLADKDRSYTIDVLNSITDTNLTDKYAAGKSSLSMPGKDKADSVVVDGNDCNIHFTGDITTYGEVKFETVWLYNTADFNITSKKNSDIKTPEYMEGKSELTLECVTVELTDAGKGKIKNIAGEKKSLDLTILNSSLELSGGVTNVDTLTLEGERNIGEELVTTCLTTKAKSDVTTLKLAAGGEWNAFGATTIGTINSSDQNINSYIATYHSLNNKKQTTGIPQLTITGRVSNPIKVKVYEGVDLIELASYENQKLVVAKTEAADKFIASGYAAEELVDGGFVYAEDGSSIVAYKDKSNYVYNGDIEKMDVLLSELGESGESTTYVKTYADAINIINNIGDKTAHYQITLLNTANNGGEIKTAVKNEEAVYGALALPAANKAASLTITGEDGETGENIQMCYTGALSPKCDLNLENVTLTEGTLDKKGNYTALNYITPNYSGVTVTFGEDVKTLGAESALPADFDMSGATPTMVFSKLTVNNSGKLAGVLDITGHTVYVNGEIKVADVVTSGVENMDTVLASKGKITIEDILGDGYLILHTVYTNTTWQKAVSQLTINGEMAINAHLTLMQYFCDKNENGDKVYQLLDGERATELFYNGSGKPASWQKVITAPKLQIQQYADDKQLYFASLEIAANENPDMDWGYSTVKYEGGVYLTNSQLTIEVGGCNEEGQAYTGYFFTWDQAVKEIDKLNHSDWTYYITLLEDIGSYGTPITTLTMPTKAANVIIDCEDGNEGILMTGTTITLKTATEIRVPIAAVKKTAGNFYAVAYTINVGNCELTMDQMPTNVDIDETGWFESTVNLSGSAKGSVDVIPADTESNDIYTNMISQIKGIGHVHLRANYNAYFNAAESDEGADWKMKSVCYSVAEGISGVGSMYIDPAVSVECKDKEVSVKNIYMGEPCDAPENTDNSDYLHWGNEYWSNLTAKNITVSESLSMASAGIKAGTSKSGDGKVTLNNVYFRDFCNSIEGKQDAKGNSLIQIKGNVSADGNMCANDSAVTIGLYYNNTAQKYARLTDGMTLLTAPNAASSWFRPNYDWYDEETGEGQSNMGPEITTQVSEYDENGVVVEKDEAGAFIAKEVTVSLYNVYKSGNVIKYGYRGYVEEGVEKVTVDEQEYDVKVRWLHDIVEVRLWVGTDTMEDTYNASAYDFMTFEEAVKAIDSMNLKSADGKTNQTYCIELLNDVEIGNESGNNKYNALSLPSKASEVTIWGNGHSITFTGNVTLKCNTTFRDVCLMPVKLVKNELVPAEVNLAAGNFKLTWHWSNVLEGIEEDGSWIMSDDYGFANVTGSSKGELILVDNSYLSANSISGFKAIRFEDCYNGIETYMEEEKEVPSYGYIFSEGNVTIQELRYADETAGILETGGNLTTNVIYSTGYNNAIIIRMEDKTMKVNGVTSYELEDGTKVKENKSVVYLNPSVDRTLINVVTIPTKSASVATGTKVLTGKYLSAADWNLTSLAYAYEVEADEVISYEWAHNAYVTGNDLFLGTKLEE